MKPKQVLEKAYGSVPTEVGFTADFDIMSFRGFKYYYLKLIRFFTR
jgi:hypothetical protein